MSRTELLRHVAEKPNGRRWHGCRSVGERDRHRLALHPAGRVARLGGGVVRRGRECRHELHVRDFAAKHRREGVAHREQRARAIYAPRVVL